MIYPLAVQAPGPSDKQGYPGLAVNAAKGVICHSMVGSYPNAYARLIGPDRASWQFSVRKDGMVLQHYPSLAVAWHAGSREWNGRLIGIEHEGGGPADYGEPLTPEQLQASVKLVRWLSAAHNFPLVRAAGLYEHNEVYATACPSGRIPWGHYMEDDVTQQDKDEIVNALKGYVDMKLIQLIAYLQQTGVKTLPTGGT